MAYILLFVLAFLVAVLLTPLVKKLAVKTGVLDIPGQPKKIHRSPTPLLGGLAVYASFLAVLIFYLIFGKPDFSIVPLKFFLGIIFSGLVLIVGGLIDDKYELPPKLLWLFPAVACAIIVWSGIGVGIKQISNPFGAPISIDYTINLLIVNCQLSMVLVWLWLMGMVFTTKFLDGLDGLCAGIALIGGLTMFALSLTSRINQPITASLAIIFCGALGGYLIYGFNPASIFLGESGSTFLGLILGVLSVILGAKIATALLVMGIPILDVAWAIIRRLWYKRSPFRGDKSHLHHRLLDIGLTQRQAVLTLYGISVIFGSVAVFLQSLGKLIALVILLCVMVAGAVIVVAIYKKQHPHIPDLFDTIENKNN